MARVDGQRLKVTVVRGVVSVKGRVLNVKSVECLLNLQLVSFDFVLVVFNTWSARRSSEGSLDVADNSGVIVSVRTGTG